jgi:hypothetical protein
LAAAAKAKARALPPDDSLGVMLLADLKAIFEETGLTVLFTSEIISLLSGMDDRPWPGFNRGKPISPDELVNILKRYGIRPGNWQRGGKNADGYRYCDFERAFSRYLPALEAAAETSLAERRPSATARCPRTREKASDEVPPADAGTAAPSNGSAWCRR